MNAGVAITEEDDLQQGAAPEKVEEIVFQIARVTWVVRELAEKVCEIRDMERMATKIRDCQGPEGGEGSSW